MQRRPRILIVDDEPLNRQLLEAMLEPLGWELEIAADGPEALAKLRLDIDLVLLDVMLPGMDGYEVAQRIRQDAAVADLPIIMVTALNGREDRLRAVEAGANDFIAKPVDRTELRVRAESLLKLKRAQDSLKAHQAELEELVARRTAALRESLQEMVLAQRRAHEAQLETIQRLALAAELRDEGTARHIERVARYSALLARRAGLSPGETECVEQASRMHDVGKIAIPHEILLKPGPLDQAEWEQMRQHPIIGSRLLAGSSSPLLRAGEVIALSHHERWNGTGYPYGLSGEQIPLSGRICAIADVFDALTSRRPYKPPHSIEDACSALEAARGLHFDPMLLEHFLGAMREVREIHAELNSPAEAPPRHELHLRENGAGPVAELRPRGVVLVTTSAA